MPYLKGKAIADHTEGLRYAVKHPKRAKDIDTDRGRTMPAFNRIEYPLWKDADNQVQVPRGKLGMPQDKESRTA